MDKKVLYAIVLCVAVGIAAFLVTRPTSPNNKDQQSTIVGLWQSIEDSKFLRQFDAEGAMLDVYDNQVIAEYTWKPFTKNNPVVTEYPLESGSVYIQVIGQGETSEIKVVSIATSSLELLYLGQSKISKFIRVP